MRIEYCWYCGKPVYPGHGIVFVRNDCQVIRFCASRCRKFYHQKSDPLKKRWTKAYRAKMGKDMIKDESQLFAKRRNRPMKYNRNTMRRTVRIMKKVKEIEHARKIEHINRTIVEIGKKNETEYKGKQRELGQAHSIIGKNAINRESLPKVGTTRQKRPDKMLIDTEKPTRNNKMRILNSK
mmetsp:Transcript_10924/g.11999  ORF Transcript_10924/g.11999 Transcript_10924/m.11999 type:complete len:181 (+) Transcript_10924:114-656(+)